ncbi:MAG: hypothetical protein ACWGSQ_09730 [Longimicrobiales bacterium]
MQIMAPSRYVTRVLFMAAGLAACSGGPPSSDPRPAETETGEGIPSPAVTEAMRTRLLNSEYRGVFAEPVRLTDGRYQGDPFTPGGASRPELTLVVDRIAAGDLDGDAQEELVALLARSDGGSGTFLYLAVLRQAGGQLENFGTVLLGDRIEVSRLEIQGPSIVAALLEHGPADPACCPTQRAWRTWEVYEGELREVAVYRGHLVYGHESHEFTSCDGEDRYWVVDGTGGDLPEVYRSLAFEPYDPVFVEVRAQFLPEAGSGFGADYEAQIRVTELFRAAREGPGCGVDLQGVDFRVMGVEPFWTLDVLPGGIEFRGLGYPTRRFGIETTSESAGLLVWSGSAEGEGTVSVEIRARRCVDPMSGAVFPLQAQVTVDGDTFHGCAMRGDRP